MVNKTPQSDSQPDPNNISCGPAGLTFILSLTLEDMLASADTEMLVPDRMDSQDLPLTFQGDDKRCEQLHGHACHLPAVSFSKGQGPRWPRLWWHVGPRSRGEGSSIPGWAPCAPTPWWGSRLSRDCASCFHTTGAVAAVSAARRVMSHLPRANEVRGLGKGRRTSLGCRRKALSWHSCWK